MVFPKTSILIQVPSRSIVKSRENTATSSRLQVMKTASAPQRRKLKGFYIFLKSRQSTVQRLFHKISSHGKRNTKGHKDNPHCQKHPLHRYDTGRISARNAIS